MREFHVSCLYFLSNLDWLVNAHHFCDVATKAYAVVTFLRLEDVLVGSRAVHTEVLPSLDAEEFINALMRFFDKIVSKSNGDCDNDYDGSCIDYRFGRFPMNGEAIRWSQSPQTATNNLSARNGACNL